MQEDGGYAVGDLPSAPHGFCEPCEETITEISPWLSVEEAKAVCLESPTFKQKLVAASQVRLGQLATPWTKDDEVHRTKAHLCILEALFEGYDSKAFASDMDGVLPEEVQLAPLQEPDLFGPDPSAKKLVYYLPAKGPIYLRRVQVITGLNHTSSCMNRQLYNSQGADTIQALNKQDVANDAVISSLMSLRSRDEIMKDVQAIASQRLASAGGGPQGAGLPRVARQVPSVISNSAPKPGNFPRVARMPMPMVPVFPAQEHAKTAPTAPPTALASPVSTESSPAGKPCDAAMPPATPPRADNRRLLTVSPTTKAGLSAEERSPPSCKPRLESPARTEKGKDPAIPVVSLAEMKGKTVPNLVSISSTKEKKADDLQSLRSSTRSAKGGLQHAFPTAHKSERPMLAFPWRLGLDGHSIKEARTQIRRAITQAAPGEGNPQGSEHHTALVNHELYLVTSAEINLPRLVEHDVPTIHGLINKLEPVLEHEQLPPRNYTQVMFRLSLAHSPPRRKAGFSEDFFTILLPKSENVEKVPYSQYEPVTWTNFLDESDIVSGVVPQTIRHGLAQYVWKPLITEGKQNLKLTIQCAGQLVTRVEALESKYSEPWSGIVSDARGLLQLFGDTPGMFGATVQHAIKLADDKGEIHQAIVSSPFYKTYFDLSNHRAACESIAWPEVEEHMRNLEAAKTEAGGWSLTEASTVLDGAIEKWPDWVEQCREPALTVFAQPKVSACLLSLAAAVRVEDPSQTSDALRILSLIRAANAVFKNKDFPAAMDRLGLAASRHAAEQTVNRFKAACLKALESAEDCQVDNLLQIKAALPAGDTRQRVSLSKVEDRNAAWQVFDLLSAKAWEASSLQDFIRFCEVIDGFANTVETTATDAGFEQILRVSKEKASIVKAVTELAASNQRYTALRTISGERIRSASGLEMIKELMKKVEAFHAMSMPEVQAAALSQEIQAIRTSADESIRDHGNKYTSEAWPEVQKLWEPLKISAGGGLQGKTWKQMLPTAKLKDFSELAEHAGLTLRKVDAQKLASETKACHTVTH